jgi:hypothetical protein
MAKASDQLSYDAAYEKYKNYLPSELMKLPKKAFSEEVPPVLASAATLAVLADTTDLIPRRNLNALMYPGLNDFKNAVIQFQTDINEKATGTLTVGQLVELSHRAKLQEVTIPDLSAQLSDNNLGQAAFISGALELIGAPISNPINKTDIQCFKQTKHCEFSQISVTLPNISESGNTAASITSYPTEHFPVISWSDNNIETGPSDANACRLRSLSLNFETNEYFYITKNGSRKEGCDLLPKLDGPRIARIVDGDDVLRQQRRQLSLRKMEVLSSSFQQEFAKWQKNYMQMLESTTDETTTK